MSWTNTKSNTDHYIKFKLAIGCFSWCKSFYVMSNFEDWENIIHFGNFIGSIGQKIYFLALGTTPVKGVGIIAGKITDFMYECYGCYTESPQFLDSRIFEPRHEKTNVLHMRKQRRRSASG